MKTKKEFRTTAQEIDISKIYQSTESSEEEINYQGLKTKHRSLVFWLDHFILYFGKNSLLLADQK